MRNLASCELLSVTAGASPGQMDPKQTQQQAGFKEDVAIEIIKIAFVAVVNKILTYFFPPTDRNKENKDAWYGCSSMVPF